MPPDKSTEKSFITWLRTMGIERWSFFVVGIGALVFGVLEFFGWSFFGWPLTGHPDKALEMALSVIGALLMASTIEAGRQEGKANSLLNHLKALSAADGQLVNALGSLATSKRADDLCMQIEQLKKMVTDRVAQTGGRVATLWDAFRILLGDEEFEETLREIIRYYPERSRDKDSAMVEKARSELATARQTLEEREYRVEFYGTSEYPERFYQTAQGEIIATNIVSMNEFWSEEDLDALLRMNREAIGRIRQSLNGKDHNPVVRRVFVIAEDTKDKEGSNSELAKTLQVMTQQQEDQVVVKWIFRNEANKIVYDLNIHGGMQYVHSLQDFTVFDRKYAGQYNLDELKSRKRIVHVTSKPRKVEELTEQFLRLESRSDSIEKFEDWLRANREEAYKTFELLKIQKTPQRS
jgi:hypothetical protein